MALVKRSTPKSRSIQSLDRIRKNSAVHVSLSVFSFQTAATLPETAMQPISRLQGPTSWESAEEAPLSGGAVSMGGL